MMFNPGAMGQTNLKDNYRSFPSMSPGLGAMPYMTGVNKYDSFPQQQFFNNVLNSGTFDNSTLPTTYGIVSPDRRSASADPYNAPVHQTTATTPNSSGNNQLSTQNDSN